MSELITRAISFPIAGPCNDEPWAPLREALTQAWGQSTDLANWCVFELLKAEQPWHSGLEKLPKAPKIDLYNKAFTQGQYERASAWIGSKGSASSVTKKVRDRWMKDRTKVLYRRESAPACYRYPFPWPVRAQDWSPSQDKRGRPVLSLTLPGGRFDVSLRAGDEFRRQLGIFNKIIKGQAEKCEVLISRQRCSSGCHRRSFEDRDPNGGRRQLYREMVKIVVQMPVVERVGLQGVMIVRTDPNAFLVAECEGRSPWILNADHVRRWQEEHKVFLQRISDDTKYEKRWPKRKRIQINDHRDQRCSKHGRRIDTWLHEASALVANYAIRCKVAEVWYDDGIRDYLPSFPWHIFGTRLADKLAAVGIAHEKKESHVSALQGV